MPKSKLTKRLSFLWHNSLIQISFIKELKAPKGPRSAGFKTIVAAQSRYNSLDKIDPADKLDKLIATL